MSETAEIDNGADHAEIRRLFDAYCREELNPALPKFAVRGPFTLEDAKACPAYEKAGCYVLYCRNGYARYVGISLSRVGTRIARHLSAKTQASPFWTADRPHTVAIIEFAQEWQAPSLEAYLVGRAYAASRGYKARVRSH